MKLPFRAQTLGLLLALVCMCGRAETLIRLDLPQDYSPLAVREMKAELGRVVAGAGLGVRWEAKSQPPVSVDGRIVSLSLQGRCVGVAPDRHESGPLGWTKSVNGRVLPYIEIACDRVGSLLEPSWQREPEALRDLQLGRALGRVLAHELAHALTRTEHHAEEGLRRRALGARDLIDGELHLMRSDFERAAPKIEVARTFTPAAGPTPVGEQVELDNGGR